MPQFNLNDYIEVKDRIEKFWGDYLGGRIHTEIISYEKGVITMKASVYRDSKDDRPCATGHAYETEGSTFINKTSALENCETSAVGRALAIMGYEIKKSIASKEEVANARLQQAEIEKKEATKKKPAPKADKKVDPDIQLKRDLMKKHNGDKEAAQDEYESIKLDQHFKEEVA